MTTFIAELGKVREGGAAALAAVRWATRPPCDELDDEVYDVALAVIFRDVAAAETLIGRIGRIQQAIDANEPTVAALTLKAQPDHAHRIQRMILVLEVWKAELLNSGGGALPARCPTCGEPVPTIFEHVDQECEAR